MRRDIAFVKDSAALHLSCRRGILYALNCSLKAVIIFMTQEGNDSNRIPESIGGNEFLHLLAVQTREVLPYLNLRDAQGNLVDIAQIDATEQSEVIYSLIGNYIFDRGLLHPPQNISIPSRFQSVTEEMRRHVQAQREPLSVLNPSLLYRFLSAGGKIEGDFDIRQLDVANGVSIEIGDLLLHDINSSVIKNLGNNHYIFRYYGDSFTVARIGNGTPPSPETIAAYAQQARAIFPSSENSLQLVFEARGVEPGTGEKIPLYLLERPDFIELSHGQRIQRLIRFHPAVERDLAIINSIIGEGSTSVQQALLKLIEDALYDPKLEALARKKSLELGINVFYHGNRDNFLDYLHSIRQPVWINRYDAPGLKEINDNSRFGPKFGDDFILTNIDITTDAIAELFREHHGEPYDRQLRDIDEVRLWINADDFFQPLPSRIEQLDQQSRKQVIEALMLRVTSRLARKYQLQNSRTNTSMTIPVISSADHRRFAPTEGESFIAYLGLSRASVMKSNSVKYKNSYYDYYENPLSIPTDYILYLATYFAPNERGLSRTRAMGIPKKLCDYLWNACYPRGAFNTKDFELSTDPSSSHYINPALFMEYMKPIFDHVPTRRGKSSISDLLNTAKEFVEQRVSKARIRR
ncbi:MAG TPA: hypothetical protein VGT05_00915 [Patescibacteria group bacterium]|nr:hypothetical protein [Patescibacteria group bacterium]